MTAVAHPLTLQTRHSQEPLRETLRERKKRLTRKAIFDTAQRLFTERGFDNVTVAEIADAANISVKTLFTYVRSKEELVFSDEPTVLDAVVAAVRNRRVGQTPLVAAASALLAAVDDDDPAGGLEGFHRMIGVSPAIQSRLRAMYDETEDKITETLATRKDGPRERAARRLVAAQIMVLVRAVASDEVRLLISESGTTKKARREALREWIRDAAGSLARGLQAAGR
ncbi:MAG TPA: helix-turn-helix domain-containing protein [Trebonia sp.]